MLSSLGVCVHKACSTSTTLTTSRLSLSVENYQDGGQRPARGEAVSKFDGKNADNFLEWFSKLRVSLSLYSKPIFEIVQGSQRPSGLDSDQVTARESWDDANHNLFSIIFFTTSGPAFSVVRRFEAKTREDGVMDRTHGELYARSSMTAHAKPCERRTGNWKR